jgi:signal transduction histidine kinase
MAEEEREKINTALVQRNKELEQFSYIVSHNLRSPVANIIGLTTMAQEETLEPEMKEEVLRGLNQSVNKLDGVISDLNNILQIKRDVSQMKERVCFSELVHNIYISIECLIDKEKATILWNFSEIDEILTLKSYMHSIFYNLISNSLKYRQPNIPPVIEITSRILKNTIELTFQDNGTGIDLSKKGEQVFGLYKRFHTDAAEGKGTGLYMVKTQVEAIGGKISLESEVNKGTTFKIEFYNKK